MYVCMYVCMYTCAIHIICNAVHQFECVAQVNSHQITILAPLYVTNTAYTPNMNIQAQSMDTPGIVRM